MAQYVSVPMPTENADVQYSVGGAVWKFLPGYASITETGGESPTRERITMKSVNSLVGKARPSTIEISVPALVPGHSSYKDLKKAYDDGTNVHIRYGFREQSLFKGQTTDKATVKKDGSVTFNNSGTPPDFTGADFGPGVAIKILSTPVVYAVIETISAAGVVKVQERAADLAEGQYDVVLPPFYRPSVTCKISDWGKISAESESEVGSTLAVISYSVLPDIVIGELK